MPLSALPAASLTLGRPDLLLPVLLSGICAVAFTVWCQRNVPILRTQKAAILLLKSLCFLLLLTCWLEPQWTTRTPKDRANTIALLLDNSQSMQMPSEDKGRSRGEHLLSVWTPAGSGWRSEIEKLFRTRSFTFAGSLREITAGRLPDFQGSSSSLGSSLSQVGDRLGQTPSGIVVFTDGITSDLGSLDAKALPPVYPVVFGSDQTDAEATLGPTTATQSAFEDAPVTISAEIHATGMSGRNIRVRVDKLEATAPKAPVPAVAQTSVMLHGQEAKTVAQLQFTPEHSGPTFYKVTMQPEDEASASPVSELRRTRLVCVNRIRGPHPILYVGGRPNWEFPPLRRALDGDAELNLRALIRVAKREPKFQFKGRGGEATNPLFRGFQNETGAEIQRYDQPVIVRVGVESPSELASGFPKTSEELFSYKALIIDHLEAEFFSPEQHRLLQRFVSERGGGLLMLGGMESFQSGLWQGTPLEAALPVWMGKDADAPDESFQWQLSREGLIQPWMRRRKSEAEEASRLNALPVLEVLNSVAGTKPAATVLALATTAASSRPALVTQRYGLGKCGAILSGDWYRWGIGDPTNAADLAKLWRQIARWLVSDAPNPVDLSGLWDPSSNVMKLQVRVWDKAAHPVENADVSLRTHRLSDAADAAIELHAEPTGEPGVFSVTNTFPSDGAWIAEAVAISSDGAEIGRAEFGWVQDHSELEWRSSVPDRAAMKDLASQTGGEVIRIEDLGQLASRLRNLPNIAVETRSLPLWHTGTLFMLTVLCLVSEWFLRRRSGGS